MSVSYRIAFDDTRRPSVTELPGLTSDPICTADRRGGILISFGPERRSSGIYNPFDLRPCRPAVESGRRCGPAEASAPRHFLLCPSDGCHLTSSFRQPLRHAVSRDEFTRPVDLSVSFRPVSSRPLTGSDLVQVFDALLGDVCLGDLVDLVHPDLVGAVRVPLVHVHLGR